MTQSTLSVARLALLAGAMILAGTPSFAADSLYVCQSGVPYAYPNGGADILFHPDQGGLGPLTNAQGVAAVEQAFQAWADVATASATFLNGGLMPFDVDITNYASIYNPPAPDGLSPIVFDEDGSIFVELFGAGSGILGFAGPDFGDPVTCELIEGSAFLNGPEFGDLIVAEDIMVHEFGHHINLGHVELNGQLVPFSEGGDTSGPTPDNTTFGTPASFIGTEVIETMYPFYFSTSPSGGVGMRTPHADDIASISTIYPAPDFASTTGTISGTIYSPNGTTRLSGVNVIARNINDPFVDAVSTFSGAYTDGTSQADPNVGVFTLSGLTPGEQYAVFVDVITANPLRFSNPLLATLPGPEEYWNGGDEANSNPPDDPLVYELITVAAGSPATGIDIIFNQPSPGDPLPVGDDGFVQLALPFPYEICGQTFDAVFVNANGSLTFGASSSDFSESAAEMLAGPPRIAGLWDDLNPSAGGVVTFYPGRNDFRVIWDGVPEYPAAGSNSFEITLKRASNHIDVAYGGIDAVDGLAGVSCGGAVTSGFETASDLSAFAPSRINLHNQPAVFELFSSSGNPNDLGDSTVRYNGTTDYNDNWAEPNDTFRKARSISLPFNSIPVTRFTEIEPVGGDVDYFRFAASAGDILIAEVVSGRLDSLIGLFDSAGNLIALDDDGGTGLLSKIQILLPADGDYVLAVTTFADFGFVGTGTSGGRYVLDLSTADELVLDLGDDDSEEVLLGFTFPYQGADWTSVWVNSNGNLTFGAGDTDFSESVADFLSGEPRIALLWDDLSPNQGGQVYVDYATDSLTVTFDAVPEFAAGNSNNFAVTLRADGSITVAYGNIDATDGLVGVTEGGGAADPGASDLSSSATWPVAGTTYELFGGGNPNDTTGIMLDFLP
jgi:hypothetical protein